MHRNVDEIHEKRVITCLLHMRAVIYNHKHLIFGKYDDIWYYKTEKQITRGTR